MFLKGSTVVENKYCSYGLFGKTLLLSVPEALDLW